MSFWFHFFIMMVAVGSSRRNTHDSDEEIEVEKTYQGEEEGIEEDKDNENDSDGHDPQKYKEKYTTMWNYFTRINVGKGGGTKKIICHHCHTKYKGSYTSVKKHICETMYWDEDKNVGIKTYVKFISIE